MRMSSRMVEKKRMRKLLILSGFALAGGCAVPEDSTALIEGVLKVAPPECTALATSREFSASSLVDIGSAAGSARSLTLPVKVRTNLPSTFTSANMGAGGSFPAHYGQPDMNIINFNGAEVVFSTDDDNEDPALTLPGLPVSEDTKRETAVNAVVFNQQSSLLTESLVLVPALNATEIDLLRGDPLVSEKLTQVDGSGLLTSTYRIYVNVRLVGKTTGGASIRSPAFPHPVDLCDGCLGVPPQCAGPDDGDPATPAAELVPVENPASCFRGVDEPSFICPG